MCIILYYHISWQVCCVSPAIPPCLFLPLNSHERYSLATFRHRQTVDFSNLTSVYWQTEYLLMYAACHIPLWCCLRLCVLIYIYHIVLYITLFTMWWRVFCLSFSFENMLLFCKILSWIVSSLTCYAAAATAAVMMLYRTSDGCAGIALFICGMIVNVHSDHILRSLRRLSDDVTSYKIPRGTRHC